MKKLLGFAVAIIVIALAIAGRKWAHDLTVELPKYPPAATVVWLDQNGTSEQRDRFHHAEGGTQTFGIPYGSFIALEQPALSLTTPGLLSDPAYLDRCGFLPGSSNPNCRSLASRNRGRTSSPLT
jgi:hypothetical protein